MLGHSEFKSNKTESKPRQLQPNKAQAVQIHFGYPTTLRRETKSMGLPWVYLAWRTVISCHAASKSSLNQTQ